MNTNNKNEISLYEVISFLLSLKTPIIASTALFFIGTLLYAIFLFPFSVSQMTENKMGLNDESFNILKKSIPSFLQHSSDFFKERNQMGIYNQFQNPDWIDRVIIPIKGLEDYQGAEFEDLRPISHIKINLVGKNHEELKKTIPIIQDVIKSTALKLLISNELEKLENNKLKEINYLDISIAKLNQKMLKDSITLESLLKNKEKNIYLKNTWQKQVNFNVTIDDASILSLEKDILRFERHNTNAEKKALFYDEWEESSGLKSTHLNYLPIDAHIASYNIEEIFNQNSLIDLQDRRSALLDSYEVIKKSKKLFEEQKFFISKVNVSNYFSLVNNEDQSNLNYNFIYELKNLEKTFIYFKIYDDYLSDTYPIITNIEKGRTKFVVMLTLLGSLLGFLIGIIYKIKNYIKQ